MPICLDCQRQTALVNNGLCQMCSELRDELAEVFCDEREEAQADGNGRDRRRDWLGYTRG